MELGLTLAEHSRKILSCPSQVVFVFLSKMSVHLAYLFQLLRFSLGRD